MNKGIAMLAVKTGLDQMPTDALEAVLNTPDEEILCNGKIYQDGIS